MHHVAEIQDAFTLLSPLLGVSVAGFVFAFALLASGQNSTITGTLAGQIIMEGFLRLRMKPWIRRLTTRVIPAIGVIVLFGNQGVGKLLILSQVVLSLQLSFAVFPLVSFTSNEKKMGPFVNSRLTKGVAYLVAGIILILNGWLVINTLIG